MRAVAGAALLALTAGVVKIAIDFNGRHDMRQTQTQLKSVLPTGEWLCRGQQGGDKNEAYTLRVNPGVQVVTPTGPINGIAKLDSTMRSPASSDQLYYGSSELRGNTIALKWQAHWTRPEQLHALAVETQRASSMDPAAYATDLSQQNYVNNLFRGITVFEKPIMEETITVDSISEAQFSGTSVAAPANGEPTKAQPIACSKNVPGQQTAASSETKPANVPGQHTAPSSETKSAKTADKASKSAATSPAKQPPPAERAVVTADAASKQRELQIKGQTVAVPADTIAKPAEAQAKGQTLPQVTAGVAVPVPKAAPPENDKKSVSATTAPTQPEAARPRTPAVEPPRDARPPEAARDTQVAASPPPRDMQPAAPVPPRVQPAAPQPPRDTRPPEPDMRAELASNEARAFIDDWYRVTSSARRPEDVLHFYAPEVRYYDRGVVPRSYIRQDKQYYFNRWPIRQTRIAGPITVSDAPGNRKVVSFRLWYRLDDGNRDLREGTTPVRLLLDKRDGRVVIIAEG